MSAMEACRSLTDAATSLRSLRISARSRLNLSSSVCCFMPKGVAVADAPELLLPAPSMDARNVIRPIHRSIVDGQMCEQTEGEGVRARPNTFIHRHMQTQTRIHDYLPSERTGFSQELGGKPALRRTPVSLLVS